jgi:hypothetical protein
MPRISGDGTLQLIPLTLFSLVAFLFGQHAVLVLQCGLSSDDRA